MPIVFLHAFPLNSEMWGPQVALRQDGIELFAYDIFGFGGSDAASKADDYTIEALISDVHNFIRDVVKRPAVICGLSLGSYIALRAALADEDDIAGLVLASVGAGSDEPEKFRKEIDECAATYEDHGIEAFLTSLFEDPSFGDARKLGPATFDRMVRSNPRDGVVLTARHILAPRTPVSSLTQGLRALKAPTLILVGRKDVECLDPAAFLVRNIPTSTLEIFEGCGHFINMEKTDLFNSKISEFVRGIKDDPARMSSRRMVSE